MMSVTITESVLRTKQAKDAISEGIVTWILTGDIQQGWDAMIKRGKKNFAYPAFKFALLIDFLKTLGDNSRQNGYA